MKKLSIIIITLIMLTAFSACSGEKPKKPTQSASTAAYTTAKASTTATEAQTTKPARAKKVTKPTEKKEKKPKKTKPTTLPPTQGRTRPNTHIVVTSPPKGSFSSSDFEFVYKNHKINFNDKLEDVFKLFGDDASIGELSSTRNEYEYDDFIITTYKKDKNDEVERVDSIEIIDEGAKTKKGAKLGMYATQLKRLYGDPNKLTETEYVYGSGAKTLTFSYEGNIVTDILYKYKH